MLKTNWKSTALLAAIAAASVKPGAAAVPTSPPFEVQVAQFLQYSLNQGYLKKVGDAYTVDLTGNGGTITINGIAWKEPS